MLKVTGILIGDPDLKRIAECKNNKMIEGDSEDTRLGSFELNCSGGALRKIVDFGAKNVSQPIPPPGKKPNPNSQKDAERAKPNARTRL